ncbi:amino acid permease [Arcanobacterium pinnipediorum]|uniref:Amino acid permease n=1 Tax=Arcanobacterium pinnipediorum TaxID=1503041 RepID=A0ABY5AH78_9ACTO|nr:amino acid permease [Arcanobacterium pinnipediorum]USR79562.1 amino acid permease [Arcanobacterium pinnipediorum]
MKDQTNVPAQSAGATSVPADSAMESKHVQLKRGLTSAQVSMIGLSGALGTGLFLGSGSVIGYGGPATVFAYLAAGFLALAVVWALAEMVSVHPVPGGHGAVAASYLGPYGGYVSRWNFAVTMLIAVGAEVTATATYLQFWFPSLPLWAGTILCSLFIVVLNLFSVQLYGSSEYWFSMIKVIAIMTFIALGLSLVFGFFPGVEAIGTGNLTEYGGFFPKGIPGLLAAICLAVFSFGGIENVSVGAAESEHPERDVPRAAHTMIWRLLLFYVLAILVVLMLQPWAETAGSHGTIDESPFVRALDITGVVGAAHIMNAVLIVAALSAANGCLYSSSRMIHSLANDRQAPRWAAVTAKNGTPRRAVLIAMIGMVIASVLALASPANAFLWLYGCATIGILVTWVMTMLTHMAFRSKRSAAGLPLAQRHLWAANIVAPIVIAASVGIFIGLYWLLPVAWYAGIPYLIILTLSYWAVRSVHPMHMRDLLAEDTDK